MSLEQELRQALKRKDPASGFDDRVLSKIAAGETAPLRLGTRRWGLASLPIAASLILSFGAAYYVQQQQQRQADERSRTRNRRRETSCWHCRSRARRFQRHRPRSRRLHAMNPKTTINGCLLLLALLIPREALAQGAKLQLDHLDKLAAKAEETVDVTVDAAMLKETTGLSRRQRLRYCESATDAPGDHRHLREEL